MSKDVLVIDNGFRPSIEGFAQDKNKYFLSLWGIKYSGIPAPAPEIIKAAYWIARRPSQYDEYPVLALIMAEEIDFNRLISSVNKLWFVGSLAVRDCRVDVNTESLELANMAIEAAVHGPNTFDDSIELLNNFHPNVK